ncbi:MAG: hypothetical protein JWM65_2117 [Sphingomonas bacterium]|nr:hypothetical protein [Sphingomonas bacterium]
MIRVRDRVADRLVSRHALSPTSAVEYQPQGRFARWLLSRLLRRRAVVEVAPGRYYLDAARYTAQNVAWERRATRVSFFGAIGLAVLAMLFYRGGG